MLRFHKGPPPPPPAPGMFGVESLAGRSCRESTFYELMVTRQKGTVTSTTTNRRLIFSLLPYLFHHPQSWCRKSQGAVRALTAASFLLQAERALSRVGGGALNQMPEKTSTRSDGLSYTETQKVQDYTESLMRVCFQ